MSHLLSTSQGPEVEKSSRIYSGGREENNEQNWRINGRQQVKISLEDGLHDREVRRVISKVVELMKNSHLLFPHFT